MAPNIPPGVYSREGAQRLINLSHTARITVSFESLDEAWFFKDEGYPPFLQLNERRDGVKVLTPTPVPKLIPGKTVTIDLRVGRCELQFGYVRYYPPSVVGTPPREVDNSWYAISDIVPVDLQPGGYTFECGFRIM